MSYRVESEEKGVVLYSRYTNKVVEDFAQLREMLGLLEVSEVVSWDAFGDYQPHPVTDYQPHPVTDEQSPVAALFTNQ